MGLLGCCRGVVSGVSCHCETPCTMYETTSTEQYEAACTVRTLLSELSVCTVHLHSPSVLACSSQSSLIVAVHAVCICKGSLSKSCVVTSQTRRVSHGSHESHDPPDSTPENHLTPPVNHVNHLGVLCHWYTTDTTALLTVTAHCHRPPSPSTDTNSTTLHSLPTPLTRPLRNKCRKWDRCHTLPYCPSRAIPRYPSPSADPLLPSERVWTEVRPRSHLNTALTYDYLTVYPAH